MAADSVQTWRAGELRIVYGQANAAVGDTLTIQGSPAPAFTLYNSAGVVVAGFNGVPCSGYNNTALASPKAWYALNTAGLAAGTYLAVISFSVVSTADGQTRLLEPETQIILLAAVEVVATYDPSQLSTSPLYQTRLHAADTDMSAPIWSDYELSQLLVVAGSVPMFAASLALRSLMADKAKLAIAIKMGNWGDDRRTVHQALSQAAEALERMAPIGCAVSSPDRVFSTDNTAAGVTGAQDVW